MTHQPQNAQELAQQALTALDGFLRAVEGGEGLRLLIDARGILAHYVQRGEGKPEVALTTKTSPLSGVTLMRGSQHFSIHDSELEIVRDAVNARKRALRKQERAEEKKRGR
jgi:hypothetical protein